MLFRQDPSALELCLAACVAVLVGAGPADANNKPASAPRAAPSRGAAFGGARIPGGGVHMPGNMAGAHLPGSMGGAHMPSSMGGAHLPSSMAAAHMPASMSGGVHSPAQSRAASTASDHARTPHMSGTREAEARTSSHGGAEVAGHAGAHGDAAREGGERGTRTASAGHEDPRIGGNAALHTRGIEASAAAGAGAALALHGGAERGATGARADARVMPRPDPHRDAARDHEFVAAHAADFHTRLVSGFTAHEFSRWRGGVWTSGWRYGRFGWWWAVGDVWYPYADPVFPYPLVVAPLVAYDVDVVEGPALRFQALPAGIPLLPPTPAGQFACASPAGFFPAVSVCNGAWTLAQNSQNGTVQ